jgi:L-threonylcarbamoyladenylate synthase
VTIVRLTIDAASPDPLVLEQAAECLHDGGIVAYPTDTLYGLAVDPRQDEAVEKLYRAKGRDSGVAIPLIAGSIDQAKRVGVFGTAHLILARAFWPGPLTIVVPSRGTASPLISAEERTVAVRVPAHPIARLLADRLNFCITATSANQSGQQPAATAAEAAAALSASIDVVLDAGPAPGGPPSTIVEIASSGPRLVRAGSIAWERVLESLE